MRWHLLEANVKAPAAFGMVRLVAWCMECRRCAAALCCSWPALPAVLQIVWLNHRKGRLSAAQPFVGEGVRLCLENSITVSILYRRSFALKVSRLGSWE